MLNYCGTSSSATTSRQELDELFRHRVRTTKRRPVLVYRPAAAAPAALLLLWTKIVRRQSCGSVAIREKRSGSRSYIASGRHSFTRTKGASYSFLTPLVVRCSCAADPGDWRVFSVQPARYKRLRTMSKHLPLMWRPDGKAPS